jgi:hypothetical protein
MSFRLFDRWLAIAAMFVLGLGVCATLANAAPYTIDFNDDPGHANGSNWQTLYVQGFNTSLGATPSPGLNAGDPVYLNSFSFYKSGTADSASNIQLAIVNSLFPSSPTISNMTTSSAPFVGLSTNTVASTAGINTGDAITFNFNNLQLSYGSDYAAYFVNVGAGGALTPVLVSALAVNYALNPSDNAFHPVNNYGTESQFNYATSNFINGGFFSTFTFAGDADFTSTLSTTVPEPSSLVLALGGFGLIGLGIRRRAFWAKTA